jgi:predicted transcriptional regulator of viral defense system
MNQTDQIERIFRKNNGYARLHDITDQGINKYQLQKLLDNQEVIKIKRGLYRWSDLDTENEIIQLGQVIPQGILCLFSAWHYYDLTTYVPFEHHVAIEKSLKILLPEYPPIKLYYWDKKVIDIGVITVEFDKRPIKIYDIDKSVCDAIKFRNKIGKDMTNEVITEYLKRKDRNIQKLIHYAQLLRVEKLLKNYLEIKL